MKRKQSGERHGGPDTDALVVTKHDKVAEVASMQRRTFLRRSAAVAAGGVATAAGAQSLEIPPSNLDRGTADEPEGVRRTLEVRGRRDAQPHRRAGEPAELVRLEHVADPEAARHHHAERTLLRAPSRRRAGHRSGRASPRDPRHGAPAAGVHHERPDEVPVGVALLLPRVLGQRPHRLDQGRVDHGAAEPRPALVRAVDRRAALVAARRGGHRSEGQVDALRRRRRRGPHALASRSRRRCPTRSSSTARTARCCGPSRAIRCARSCPAGKATSA